MKKHSKAFVFFAVSKQIPIVYSADRGRAETKPLSHPQKEMLMQLQEETTPPNCVGLFSLSVTQAHEATVQAGIALESVEKEPQREENSQVEQIRCVFDDNWNDMFRQYPHMLWVLIRIASPRRF